MNHISIVFSFLLVFGIVPLHAQNTGHHTRVEIRDSIFCIDGRPTFSGRTWHGRSVEGLLPNSRMVQGIFDDLNPESRGQWAYPDTKTWDAERNTAEFVAAMSEWRSYGLLSFTLNLQGGSPLGYGNKNWINTAYYKDGSLRPEYFRRLEKILDRADALGMVPILGLFYFGQDEQLADERAVVTAVDKVVEWLCSKGYENILIEINNECNMKDYDHDILKPGRVAELIRRVQSRVRNGHRFYVSTSFGGNTVPTPNVMACSDFILLHGNGIQNPVRIGEIVREVRSTEKSKKPILFNEDDHYDFDMPVNNFAAATNAYASWGYFDFRRNKEAFEEGYQCPPVDWGIHSGRKKAFFRLLKEITGGMPEVVR